MASDLSPDQTRRVLEAVRALVARDGTKGRAAATLCLHERTLDNLLKGTFVPDEIVLKRIAAARGLTVEGLVNGDG